MYRDPQLHISAARGQLQPVVAPVENRQFVKPKFGLWTSTYQDGSSAWVEWCRSEDFGNPDACTWYVLQPDPAARVYVIDTCADLEALHRQYHESVLFGLTSFACLDFEAIAEQYDAIHLTDAGQWATRNSHPSLYGWDCESTLWFRWRFTSIERLEPVSASA